MAIISMLDGILIDCVASILAESRKKVGKETLLVGWGNEDRTRLWLEHGDCPSGAWHVNVLAAPLDSPRPDYSPVSIFLSGPAER